MKKILVLLLIAFVVPAFGESLNLLDREKRLIKKEEELKKEEEKLNALIYQIFKEVMQLQAW
jgi:hypothetical protein